MAAQPRRFPTMGGSNAGGRLASGGDTTYTKIFVGGLAWETQHDTLGRYFEQFGEILEAVVITDKHTGRSKGYGFVTFKDPESATRACEDPTPVIDGRRANCNLASLGAAHRPRPPAPQYGMWRPRPAIGSAVTSSAFRGPTTASASTAYYHHPTQYAYPYSFYGYSGGYSQENIYPMSYYGIAGGQHHQFSPSYPVAAPGFVHSFYPYYAPTSHPQIPQYPYLPPNYASGPGILSLPPTSIALATPGVTPVAAIALPSFSQQPGAAPDRNPSA